MKSLDKLREKLLQNNNVISSEDNSKLFVLTQLGQEVIHQIKDVVVLDEPNKTNKEYILEVPWTLDNAQILSTIGTSSLSPIMKKEEYDWPGEQRPFDHQYIISAFLSINKRSFCLADMGTGKTLSTMHAINYLYKKGKIKKVLIVCPLSVMRDAWKDTLEKMKIDLTCEIIYAASKSKRIELISKSEAQIHVINPDGVEVVRDELLNQNYDLIVIDELTTYKTETTARWKHLNQFTSRAEYVWGITGTPVPNSTNEAYGQIKIVKPDNLIGISFRQFKENISYSLNTKFFESTASSIEEFDNVETSLELVYKYFNPAIRIKKEDCLNLPPMVSIKRHCKLSVQQERMIKQLKESGKISIERGNVINAANGAGLVNKIIQACCGAIYDNEKRVIELDSKTRIKETIELITQALSERTEKNKGKTLVFVPFKHTLEILYKALSKHFQVAKINSDVKEKERADIFYRLQNTDTLDVILAIPTTMSHGITATSASLIIWYAPVHSCETYMQACNRIHRAGQTQNMTIAHLYGSSIEEQMYNALENKKLTLQKLLDLYKEFIEGK